MERRVVTVRGIVQGVGFRPFVYHLATARGLGGTVQNCAGDVLIDVEGDSASLDAFLTGLTAAPPPLARIEHLSWEPRPVRGRTGFSIAASDEGRTGQVFIAPDVAPCPACLAELADPADRRYRYPFLNCTDCGPRLTIITGSPYDRARTTMAPFRMCADCRAEFETPADRRFHAQPVACPACGPRLSLVDASGGAIPAADPLRAFADAVLAGRIGALKGVGGFALVCDAVDPSAVAELRRRKQRDEKPFAVMVGDVPTAEQLCHVSAEERAVLASPARPIVLLRRRGSPDVSDLVAPRNPWLGVMLPPSPLHHLLAGAAGGRPLVMTSGNRSDEPIAYRDEDARITLAGIADLFLTHDRAVRVRCDDSVTRVVDRQELAVRRSRGYAPQPVGLPMSCAAPVLAVGGQLKGTFALGRHRQAFLSHHLGDLGYSEAYRAFVRDVGLYEDLFDVRPAVLAHDLHPDYATTRYAAERAARDGLRLVGVQHHHAHLASCMAEHGLTGPVIGVCFDGSGYGTDGTVWGGEFLVGDYGGFRRAGYFRPVGLPGGDRAVREPWRMAVAHLVDAGLGDDRVRARVNRSSLRLVRGMLERGVRTPLTSSVGRLFDAVAALAGVRDVVGYEGQAAIELEALATSLSPDEARAAGSYPFETECRAAPGGGPGTVVIDTRPLITAVSSDADRHVSPAVMSCRFHAGLAGATAEVCRALRGTTGINAVALSGGVFQNGVVTAEVRSRLTADGFAVYRHRLVPPNDGGLSLGQLAVAVTAAGAAESQGRGK